MIRTVEFFPNDLSEYVPDISGRNRDVGGNTACICKGIPIVAINSTLNQADPE